MEVSIGHAWLLLSKNFDTSRIQSLIQVSHANINFSFGLLGVPVSAAEEAFSLGSEFSLDSLTTGKPFSRVVYAFGKDSPNKPFLFSYLDSVCEWRPGFKDGKTEKLRSE